MNNKKLPLKRKAIAVWLVDNTSLTFDQIADFCGLHTMEIEAIADGDTSMNLIGENPIYLGQLTREMISACEKDPKKSLELKENTIVDIKVDKRKTKYVPISRRNDKPSGILFLIKHYPNINNSQIKKLIGTTSKMIESIREKTYWNYKNIVPKDPVLLGLCSQSSFNSIISEIEE